MEKPMKASVVPATEQADRSVYEALAMMVVEFYKRNPEFVEHPERMAEHEPERQLLGQCRDGELLRLAQDRTVIFRRIQIHGAFQARTCRLS